MRFGIIGLGRMGATMALAAMEHGDEVVGHITTTVSWASSPTRVWSPRRRSRSSWQASTPTGESEPVRFRPEPLGDRTLDDAFDGLADPPEFRHRGSGRRLSVRFIRGYPFAQVYTPPAADFISFER
jgi:hypothetical protein